MLHYTKFRQPWQWQKHELKSHVGGSTHEGRSYSMLIDNEDQLHWVVAHDDGKAACSWSLENQQDQRRILRHAAHWNHAPIEHSRWLQARSESDRVPKHPFPQGLLGARFQLIYCRIHQTCMWRMLPGDWRRQKIAKSRDQVFEVSLDVDEGLDEMARPLGSHGQGASSGLSTEESPWTPTPTLYTVEDRQTMYL